MKMNTRTLQICCQGEMTRGRGGKSAYVLVKGAGQPGVQWKWVGTTWFRRVVQKDPRSGVDHSCWRWVPLELHIHIKSDLLDCEDTTPLLHPIFRRTSGWFFVVPTFYVETFWEHEKGWMGWTHFSKSNDNARLLVTFLLNFCHTNPLKSRDKKVLRVSVITWVIILRHQKKHLLFSEISFFAMFFFLVSKSVMESCNL